VGQRQEHLDTSTIGERGINRTRNRKDQRGRQTGGKSANSRTRLLPGIEERNFHRGKGGFRKKRKLKGSQHARWRLEEKFFRNMISPYEVSGRKERAFSIREMLERSSAWLDDSKGHGWGLQMGQEGSEKRTSRAEGGQDTLSIGGPSCEKGSLPKERLMVFLVGPGV